MLAFLFFGLAGIVVRIFFSAAFAVVPVAHGAQPHLRLYYRFDVLIFNACNPSKIVDQCDAVLVGLDVDAADFHAVRYYLYRLASEMFELLTKFTHFALLLYISNYLYKPRIAIIRERNFDWDPDRYSICFCVLCVPEAKAAAVSKKTKSLPRHV